MTEDKEFNIKYDWEFNVLNIYNYRKPGWFKQWFDFIKFNHASIKGDLVEAGVYRGKTLLATALFLKEIGSKKKIYGFDSFSGFPSDDILEQDQISNFEIMFKNGMIEKNQYLAIKKNLEYKSMLDSSITITPNNISSSGNFSSTSYESLQDKISILGLDNIVLIKGPFKDTMNEKNLPNQIFSVFFDCDLYSSYIDTFNATWPKLSLGGFCYFDEYYSLKFPGAKLAVIDFLKSKKHKMIKSNEVDPYCEFERWGCIKL